MSAHIKLEGGGPGLVYLEILGEPYKLVATDGDDAARAARYLTGIEAEALAARPLLHPEDGLPMRPLPTLTQRRAYTAARAANEGVE